MTNILVGDVYQRIIEEVISESSRDFEESGIGLTTLGELQQEWQSKLSQRSVAQMPWDPKPAPQPSPNPPVAAPAANNNSNSQPLPASSYASYEQPPHSSAANGTRVKTEPENESHYGGPQSGYAQAPPPQGGAARAQQLVQEQFGPNAINGMQQSGGLALPGGQQQRQPKPQGLQLPAQNPHPGQQQYSVQHQQAMQRQQQQHQFQQQQSQPRIKVENDNPSYQQRPYQPQHAPSNYSQLDGADDNDSAHEQWKQMLAERRAKGERQGCEADRMMREHVLRAASDLQSGLMIPLDEKPSKHRKRGLAKQGSFTDAANVSAPVIPQLDGDVDDGDAQSAVKDEDDEDAINSDLDDSDDDGLGALGDDDDDIADTILCTYDKVQRVKNKWKCVLKDGVMNVGGKEWVFHKGTGEFEW